MIVVCFGDGLGNQMFQYALYKELEHRFPDNRIKMDIFRIYGSYIHNGFELDKVFNITRDECNENEAFFLADHFPYTKKYCLQNKIANVRRKYFGVKSSYITQDDPTVYYEDIFCIDNKKSYMYCGNWIHEKYFLNVKNMLTDIFTFPEITDDKNRYWANRIINFSNSVSVHIRKGDYNGSGMINLGKGYYQRAKEIICSKIDSPKFFIFTDEPDKIKEYISIFDDAEVISHNKKANSYRDMQLMSLCSHNIIANSTFSFWGAYLNQNQDKIVIAPNRAKVDFKNPFAMSDWILVPSE